MGRRRVCSATRPEVCGLCAEACERCAESCEQIIEAQSAEIAQLQVLCQRYGRCRGRTARL